MSGRDHRGMVNQYGGKTVSRENKVVAEEVCFSRTKKALDKVSVRIIKHIHRYDFVLLVDKHLRFIFLLLQRLTEVGRFEIPKLQGKYESGQVGNC